MKDSSTTREKIIKVSRERYGTPRKIIEEKISRWSGILNLRPVPQPAAAAAVLYDVRCSRCGKDTKVVFPPDGSRPVYCKACRKKIEREKEQQRPAPGPETISLKEATSREHLHLPLSERRTFNKEKIKKEKTKRKEVNLEELKKILEKSLKEK